jgi:hypothetical protein
MDARVASKYILKKLLNDFEKQKDMPNQVYLETQLTRLHQMNAAYKAQAINAGLSAHQRAKARDLEQNCLGLINGIKFGISFWLHENEDLLKLDTAVVQGIRSEAKSEDLN